MSEANGLKEIRLCGDAKWALAFVMRKEVASNDDVPDVDDLDLECRWDSTDCFADRSHREAAEKIRMLRRTIRPSSLGRGRRGKDFDGDYATEAVFLCNMRGLKIVAASVLLVIWIPATSLCLAENAGLVADNDHCGGHPSSQTSPCCALASAIYKTSESPVATMPSPALIIVWLVNLPQLIWPPTQVAMAESGVSPPELSKTWQFSFRAALTPRAPSAS